MAAKDLPRAIVEVTYAEHAREYLRGLPPEHFMEATPQATQRKITLESLDLVAARRPDFHLFNELLVQYERRGERRPGQVVPDNMVVVHDGPLDAEGSYDVPVQPAGPFWVLEYVSKSNKRKDYEDNMRRYERELKVPYYLLFYPDTRDLSLFRRGARKYASVKANARDRYAIGELEMEVALLDGWVRYWYQGQLLPLPADLQRDLDEARQELARAQQQLGQAQQQLGQAQQQLALSEGQVNDLQRQLQQEAQSRRDLEAMLARLQAGQQGPPNTGAP